MTRLTRTLPNNFSKTMSDEDFLLEESYEFEFEDDEDEAPVEHSLSLDTAVCLQLRIHSLHLNLVRIENPQKEVQCSGNAHRKESELSKAPF